MDMLDGVEFPLLSACSRDDATRRIWRAQTTVLFGWLEAERSEFLSRHRRTILESARRRGAPVADLDALEWSEIARLAKATFGARDRRTEFADEARAARNALAHLKPIHYEQFARSRSFSRSDRGKESAPASQ